MRFSVVEFGYDSRQVDSCLDELAVRLSRLAARAEGATGTGREWDRLRWEAARLCDLVERRRADGAGALSGRSSPPEVEREAAEALARARFELDAARDEARQLREQAYADAVRARRDVEAALAARRLRATRLDEILIAPAGEPVATDTPTAAASVPPGGVPTS
ncbi:ATPase [Micromonospora rubida]|uniref:ATPase n=1 Tax=Micromonospora rubida TaxID=2697657 RepID=UPI001377A591|nr:ATPase [Micromonospora rubida]NBE83170.1 ATPase [Micromonospora rubida]